MYDTVLFCEKPAHMHRLAVPLAQRYNPDTSLVVFGLYNGPGRFQYPRGHALRGYPLLTSPSYQWSPEFFRQTRPLAAYLPGHARIELPPEKTLDFLRAIEAWVYVADPDRAGIRSFWETLTLLKGISTGTFPLHYYSSLMPEAVQRAIAEPTTTDQLRSERLYGEAKRYFDWNWNVNALAVMGPALRAAGAANDHRPLSKFGLQLLYRLRGQKPIPVHILFGLMERWPGTGKYPVTSHFGSTMSHHAILDYVRASDLVALEERRVSLTSAGERLLELLHPGCEDADLPARLDQWCRGGLTVSQSAMDRYLRTVFGRQLAFSRKVHGGCHGA